MDRLQNKAYKDYDYVSRYSGVPYYYDTEDDRYIYGTGSNLNEDTIYTLYTVKKGDSWDSISLDAYNSPTLFWVICDFNRIQDPFKEPNIGDKVKIPVLTELSFE